MKMEDAARTPFGRWLKNWRESLPKDPKTDKIVSQATLAQRLGVSLASIVKWETGRGLPEHDNVELLARNSGKPALELYHLRYEGDPIQAQLRPLRQAEPIPKDVFQKPAMQKIANLLSTNTLTPDDEDCLARVMEVAIQLHPEYRKGDS